jgi:RNA polymerase sigma-70 factor (ECF subfamily)
MTAGTLKRCAVAEEGPAEREHPAQVLESTEVYEARFRYVWRCLRSLGVREAQLDDALQDVFIVVQRRLGEFDGQVALSTWLYAIALRVARKARERARREAQKVGSVGEGEEPASSAADAEVTLQCSERLLLARAALESLDDDKREVFVLAQVEQMSAPEMARIIGVPLNTIYSRLRAARQAFASEVQRLSSRHRSAP